MKLMHSYKSTLRIIQQLRHLYNISHYVILQTCQKILKSKLIIIITYILYKIKHI